MTKISKISYKFILAPILLAIFVNIIIFVFGINNSSKNINNKFSKYGYIIGIIWTIIFGFIGYTYYLSYKESNKYFTPGTITIILYIIFALSYPFITARFIKLTGILNIISLLFACILTINVVNEYWMKKKSFKILFYLLPLLLWLLFVNIFYKS